VRRTRISLTTPRPAPSPRQDDHDRVAPPEGLRKFDLGSVPASVTPPPTWRRAAWFATLSSGGVVVALMFAGSVLMSQPLPERQAMQGWLDSHGGGGPTLPRGGLGGTGTATPSHEPDSARATRTPNSPAPPGSGDRPVADRPARGPDTRSQPPRPSGLPIPTTAAPSQPSMTARPVTEPRKPSPTPAPASTEEQRHVLAAHDARVLARRSQEYLDTVTEDAAAAYRMTTGELAADGPEGLRSRYADIAYFEVRHVYLDQNEGYTVNTVHVTYRDGTTQRQTRTLAFAADGRIASDTPEPVL
jgi:hypothetical protein